MPSATVDSLTGEEIVALCRKHTLYEWSIQSKVDPIPVARAEGVYFWTPEGKRFLDFNSQLMCTNIGHSHPKVVKAIQEQVAILAYANPFMATEPRARLGAKLAEITPGDIDSFFFTNGGAEAIESAIRVARVVTGRHKIMARYRSYHGGSAGAVALTGDPRRWASEPGIPGVVRIPDFHKWGRKDPEPVDEALADIEEIILYEGGHTIAAIVVETVVGSNGILIPPDGYMQGLRKICDRHGILLVADEVMAGFGRTGKWFAIDHWGVVPDLMTIAKGLTSAYVQLGALAMRPQIARVFQEKAYPSGLTYNSHTLACAAAIATLAVYEDEGLIENARANGRRAPPPHGRDRGEAPVGRNPSQHRPLRDRGAGAQPEGLRAHGRVQRHLRRDGRPRQVLPRERPLHPRAVERLLHEPAARRSPRRSSRRHWT